MTLAMEVFKLVELLEDRVTNLEKQVKLNEDTIATILKELREYLHNITNITKT